MSDRPISNSSISSMRDEDLFTLSSAATYQRLLSSNFHEVDISYEPCDINIKFAVNALKTLKVENKCGKRCRKKMTTHLDKYYPIKFLHKEIKRFI